MNFRNDFYRMIHRVKTKNDLYLSCFLFTIRTNK